MFSKAQCLGAVLLASTCGCGGSDDASAPTNPGGTQPPADWLEDTPESRRVDSTLLASTLEQLASNHVPAHSLLLVRDGAIVLDAPVYPYGGDTVHDLASVTKSVTAALVGIAIARGDIASVHEPLLGFFPERTVSDPDGRKAKIEIEHLLTMTSGFECGLTPGEPELYAMIFSDDWVGTALDLPMSADPGARFAYCSCNHHLLSAILTKATGMTAEQFARKVLFDPIGIGTVIWPAGPGGYNHGWGDLKMTPRDMARFGYLFLHDGTWEGQQILPPDWVERSRTEYIRADDAFGYAYSWWLPRDVPGVALAMGRGGQYIAVWPERDAVVALTGGGSDLDQIAPLLLPALTDDVLPSNPDGEARLAAAIAELRKAPDPVSPPALPAAASQINGTTYALSDNLLELKSIALAFPGGPEAQLTLQDGSGTKVIPVGMDGVPRFSAGSFGLQRGVRAEWENDTFLLVYDEVANINRYEFTLALAGDDVTVHVKEATGTGLEATMTGTPQ